MSVDTDVSRLRDERRRVMEEANNLTEGVGHALRPLTRDEKGRLDDLHDRAADLLDRIRELEAGR